jgi:hypothetical protein
MRVSVRALAVALACVSSIAVAQQSDQQSDQAAAARVLGPPWKQLSRRAGMIFAGTVLSTSPTPDRATAGPTPSIELIFRVEEPIAGVERGQILTIHEWSGAWSMHRPMIRGERILIFLYPPSRLGLTSPVGGSLGQVALDSSGETVSAEAGNPAAPAPQSDSPSRRQSLASPAIVTVLQLERAIRAARATTENTEE